MSNIHQMYRDVFDKGIVTSVVNAITAAMPSLRESMTSPVKDMLTVRDDMIKRVPHAAIVALTLTGGLAAPEMAQAQGFMNYIGNGTNLAVVVDQVAARARGQQTNANDVLLSQSVGQLAGRVVSGNNYNHKNTGIAEMAGYAATRMLVGGSNSTNQQQVQQPQVQLNQNYQNRGYQNDGHRQSQQPSQQQYIGQNNAAAEFQQQAQYYVQTIVRSHQNGQFDTRDQTCDRAVQYAANNASIGIRSQEYETSLQRVCPQNIVQRMYGTPQHVSYNR